MTETKTAVIAGGCFWGMEELIRNQPGVAKTRVGYTGGALENPTYNDVKTGKTGHAEAIEITYDPAVMSYEKLLHWFFQIHDPTTKDRQGNDIGTQYRSAIWFEDAAQRETAEKVIATVEASGHLPGPVVTELAPAQTFWEAEDFHQDYLQKYPDGYTCHFVRPEWKIDGPAV